MQMERTIQKPAITVLDIRIMITVGICFITANLLGSLGFRFTWDGMQLEIIQRMTACIACLLCCQDTAKISRTTGINRLIITAIGGAIGILVVLADSAAGSPWLLTAMICSGVLLTILLCKAAGVPYMNARIGAVTFVLVACTLSGPARIFYAVFRWISTVYGVLVVLAVSMVFERVRRAGRAELL